MAGDSPNAEQAQPHHTATHQPLTREPTREEKIQEAIAEGHDADIPSNIGYILSDKDEQKRRLSIQMTRQRNNGDLEKSIPEAESSGADEDDSDNVVWWESDTDPQNPYNWPRWQKVLNCILISSLTFVTPLASSMFAPGVPELMIEFKSTSRLLASFCVSVYVLGFAAGPMIFAPLSELYGRLVVYHGCNIGFIVFVVACAKAPSLATLCVFRFFSGIFGACPITNGGGTIADMIVQEKRGAAMASFAIGPLLGPIIGPVVGGVVTDALGWRWVFWILALISGGLSITFFLLSRETYAPVILNRKVKKLQKETGNPLLRSKLDPGLSPTDYFKRGIRRPFKLLLLSPVCIICGIYVGLAYAYLYLMFTSLTPLFMQIYHFNIINAGLTFLGLGVGSMIGVLYFSIQSDRDIKRKTAAAKELTGSDEDAEMKPEYRLAPLKVGSILLPVGLFIYGWTAEYKVHWIAPILGTTVMGIGNIIVFMSLQMYLVDSFTTYAASALAANAVMRSFAGALLPLAGLPMYDKLGMGWGNSLLGFIAILMIPAPWLFIKHGEYLRKRFEIKDL